MYAVLLLFEALPPTGAAMVFAVELVLLLLLAVVLWVAEAFPLAEADFDALAFSESLEDFDADVVRAACCALLSVAEADSEALADLVELSVVASEADLLDVAFADAFWLAVALVDRLSVFEWLRVRLLLCVSEVLRDELRVLLLDALLVTSDLVESVAEILAPRV